ncbi:unnamed protein product, partial [Prorocentrum cordatum]
FAQSSLAEALVSPALGDFRFSRRRRSPCNGGRGRQRVRERAGQRDGEIGHHEDARKQRPVQRAEGQRVVHCHHGRVPQVCGHVHHNAEERLPAAHGPRAALGHEDGRRLLRPGGPRHDGRHRHGLRVHDLKPAPGCRPPRWSRCHLPRPALAVCSLPQRPRRGAGGDPRREVSGSGPREAEKAPSPCLAVCSLPPLLRHCRRTLLPCSTSPCASLRTPRRWRRGLSASARPAGQEASPARGGGLSVARCLGDER